MSCSVAYTTTRNKTSDQRTVWIAGDIVSSGGVERQERRIGRVEDIRFHATFPGERPAPGTLEADEAKNCDDDDKRG